jgi:hypothetical protein
MLIKKEQLSRAMKIELAGILKTAVLSTRFPLPKGVVLQDLAKTGFYSDRFNDGKYQVTFEGQSWYFDLGIDSQDVQVKWDVSVDSNTGSVIAQPSFASVITGPDPSRLSDAVGLHSQIIGSLGPLELLVPPGSEFFLNQLDAKNVYASVDSVAHLRVQLKAVL